MFTESFFSILIVAGLAGSGLGVLILLVLLVKDWLRGELW